MWYVSGEQGQTAVLGSEVSFRGFFEKNGAPISDDQIFHIVMSGKGAQGVIDRYLDTPENERPTAIACVNDLTALGVMRAAEKSGLSVPQDISITGCDGAPQAKWVHPQLTTVNQPLRLFGQRAAEILVAASNGDRTVQHASFPW